MEDCSVPRMGDGPQPAAGDHRTWLLVALALLLWQGWLTLSLFGPSQPWNRLRDAQPILSGRHPLHLYHGYLGARALYEHGALSCYDPSYHAGYPKTPVFDSGSRPAELLLTLAGGRFSPAIYKFAVAGVCAVVPLLLYLAARGTGLSRSAACLACLLGMLVWWGQPCRDTLEAGDVDLLLATLLLLVQAGLLIRYHNDPGPISWLGIVGAAVLGWFAQPMLMVLMLPLVLIYYLSVGTRHRLAWHLALLGGLVGAIGINCFWLIDWISYWWIRVPPHLDSPFLEEPSLRALWETAFWGGPVDKGLLCLLVLAATTGVLLFNQSCQRATARLLGLAWGGFLILASVGLVWEPLGRLGAPRLLVPALLFVTLPAAHAMSTAVALCARRRAGRWASLAIVTSVIVFLGVAPPPALASWATRLLGSTPLQLGLDTDQQTILQALKEQTTSQARILWEDRTTSPLCSHWTPLLALWTERAYVGGLDAESGIEHTTNGLVDALLMGRPIRDWKDEDLQEYCERYNIGWVVCWSPAACERLAQWSAAKQLVTLPACGRGEATGCLFRVCRKRYSFALAGSARWLDADPQRIVLADVAPQRGSSENRGKHPVLLSLHYQAGMRVAPSRVELEPYRIERAEPGADDSTPFVRLWVDEPVTRVTITWEKR